MLLAYPLFKMITASIVVHKSPVKQIKKALECLNDSSVDRIFIIDNSPSNVLKEIVEVFPKVEYSHVENKGFGAGHNIAIQKSWDLGATYHLVMNADLWWEGDVIRKMKEYMDNNIKVGMMAPKTYYPNGELQYTCRMLPTPGDMFLRGFLPEKWSRKKMRKYLLEDFDHGSELNCPYLLGSFMFFRNEALKEIGKFDERFFMYPEDIDITRRIHENWKTLYWPGVSIIHEHQQASKKSFKMFWIHFSNMVKYFNKWGWIFDAKRKSFNNDLLSSIDFS